MVDRFLVNLNRGEGQEEKLARWRKRRESLTLYVFLLLFIVLSVINYNSYKNLKLLVQAKERKIAQINQQLEELKRQGQNVSKADVMAIAKYEKTRFLWTKKFHALADVLPKEIAVTGMEFANDACILKFISKVKKEQRDFDKISEMMELLRGTQDFYEDFADIKFNESQRIIVDEQDILSFSVRCELRKTITTTRAERASQRRRM